MVSSDGRTERFNEDDLPDDAESSTPSESQRLTKHGAMLGSPHYMAPEQWVDAASADARVDQYALAALSYEALVGEPAFAGKNLRAIARAHARRAIPPLGQGFPTELDEILRRAGAKRADERFGDVLELARAFREASGIAVEAPRIPPLEELLRSTLVGDAPQPIAEAVAAFEAARNVHQARAAMWSMVDVVAHYLGLIALACRSRVRLRGQPDSEPVVRIVRELRRDRLDPPSWATLARELCRPFAGTRDAHPVPELVALFFPDESSPDPFDALWPGHHEAEKRGTSSPAQVREHIATWLPEVTALLRATLFVCEYPLVAARTEHAERWTGTRRATRPTAVLVGEIPGRATHGAHHSDGHLVLATAEGSAIVALWPLMQIARPAPGADEDLFLLSGNTRSGALLVAEPEGLEHHDDTVWTWLAENILPDDDVFAHESEAKGTPYRGLATFSSDDASYFFGRERDVATCVNRLRQRPLCAVVGPSGTGKSSLVQAGLIPALGDGWTTITVRPGSHPMATLIASLPRSDNGHGHGDGDSGDREADDIADFDGSDSVQATVEPEIIGARLRSHARARGVSVLLVIDQLEELFTMARDPGERQAYASALSQVARAASDPVRVVVTLRDDFLAQAAGLSAFRGHLVPSMQLLTAPGPEDLRRILVLPAERAGFDFEDDDLPDEMVAEVTGQSAALPLLSFAAARMWEQRDRQFRHLTRASYRDLGGVGGALAGHADAVLDAMPAERRATVRALFRHLVTAEGTRARLTRSEAVQLADGPHADEVIETLVDARILSASESDEGDCIEVIHETLLSRWERLVEWQREDAEGARMRDQLRQAARQWNDSDRARGLLWRGDILAEYRRWRERFPGSLTDDELAFTRASAADESRGRRVRRAAISIALLVLTIGVVLLYLSNRRSEQLITEQYQEQGRIALLAGEPAQARRSLDEAHHRGADNPALHFMRARATEPFLPLLRTFRGHRERVWDVAYSPDGEHLVTAGGDQSARIWDIASGTQRQVLQGHSGWVWKVTFSSDGARLATAGYYDGRVGIWDARDLSRDTPLFWLDAHVITRRDDGSTRGQVTHVVFSPDDQRIVTTGGDGKGRLWSIDGELLGELTGHTASVVHSHFHPDGTWLVTCSLDGTARIWDPETGESIAALTGHEDALFITRFSPDGNLVLTVSKDETARLWKTGTWELLHVLSAHEGAVTDGSFASDSSRVATVSRDGTARIWDCETGERLATLRGHNGFVNRIAFIADDQRVVTVSQDRTARIWDANAGVSLAVLAGHDNFIFEQAMIPGSPGMAITDGEPARMATASWDRTAKLWDLSPRRISAFLSREPGMAVVTGFSDDRIVTGGRDEPTRLWSTDDGRLVSTLPDNANDAAAIVTDDRTIVVVRHDRTIVVWRDDGVLQVLPVDARSVHFLPDGRLLVLTRDWRVQRWNLQSAAMEHEDRLDLEESETARLHVDGLVALQSDPSPEVALLDRETFAVQATLRDGRPDHEPTSASGPAALRPLASSADGDRVITVSGDDTIGLWDANSGALLQSARPLAQAFVATFGPRRADAVQVAVIGTSDGSALVWNAETGEQLGRLEGHRGFISCVDISPDGAFALTGAGDKTAKMWDLTTFRLLDSLNATTAEIASCELRANARHALIVSANEALVWNVEARVVEPPG